VANAAEYEVYFDDENTPPTSSTSGITENVTINGTTAVITGLDIGTTYYVWVRAKNSGGVSAYSAFVSGTTSLPANLKGYHQTNITYSKGWESNEWVFIDDGFVIDNAGTTFTYYDAASTSIGYAGDIVAVIPENTTDGRIFIKITNAGSWGKTVDSYYGIAYKNLSSSSVSQSSAYKSGSSYNNGISSLAEAITEYADGSEYFGTYGNYPAKTVVPGDLSNLQGTWYYEDMEMYVVIRSNTFLYFMDGDDEYDGVYAPDDDEWDMLNIAGEIVGYTVSSNSGILYIHTVVPGDTYSGYLNDKYEAIAWNGLSGNDISFFFNQDNHSSLEDVKTAYTDPSNGEQFPSAGFYEFEKQ
jgi:hypothetical protein